MRCRWATLTAATLLVLTLMKHFVPLINRLLILIYVQYVNAANIQNMRIFLFFLSADLSSDSDNSNSKCDDVADVLQYMLPTPFDVEKLHYHSF